MNIWTYVFISITMILFLQFAGFPTALGEIFDDLGLVFSEDGTGSKVTAFQFTTSTLRNFIFNTTTGLLATLIGGGIALGLFVTGRSDIAIFAGVASSVLIIFLPTMAFSLAYAIENNFSFWIIGILTMIFVPLSLGYIMAILKYIGTGS